MQSGRELDVQVAQEIFGHQVVAENDRLQESTAQGLRPLLHYSTDMVGAWLVAEKMRISLMPVDNGNWFAFAGPIEGWTAPEAFLEYLKAGDFSLCGASVGENAAQAICEAALVAHRKRNLQAQQPPLTLVTPENEASLQEASHQESSSEKPQTLH